MISPLEIVSYEICSTRLLNRIMVGRDVYKYFHDVKSFGLYKTQTSIVSAFTELFIRAEKKFFKAFGKDGVTLDYKRGVYR